MADQPKTMREFSPVTFAYAKNNLARDLIEHERLIARRDALRDKLRSGLVTLNAGSLLALLAALNGEGAAAAWFGVDAENAKWVAACFVAGLFAAGASYHIAEYSTNMELSDSIESVSAAQHRVAIYEKPATSENNQELKAVLDDYSKIPLVGFRVSIPSIVTLSLSQCFWTMGVLIPLATVLFA